MAYHYETEADEADPYRLPSIETFYLGAADFAQPDEGSWMAEALAENGGPDELAGWYVWCCFPGCMPESDFPSGPYASEAKALAAFRQFGQ